MQFAFFYMSLVTSPTPAAMDSCERFNVDNGMFVPEHSPVRIGVKGTYQCNSGFILNGTAERVCTISNEWSGQSAECIRPPGRNVIE